MTDAILDKLTSGKLLAQNTIWNFLGQGLPMIAALFTIPMIIKGLGTDRFGILTLVWIVIGYVSLFDLGLGRALTQLVSKKLGEKDLEDIPALIWTAMIIISFFGIIGMSILFLIAPWFVTKILKIPSIYTHETIHSMYLLAACLPILIITSCIRGILEAYQKFFVSNLIRIFIGLCNYVGPVIVLIFSNSLVYVVATLITGRLITLILYFFACSNIVENFSKKIEFNKSYIKPLMSFGSWLTISNIIDPIMSYFDRFYIINIFSLSVVAYYTTPQEMIIRLWAIQGAIMGVLFPAFCSEYVKNRERTTYLYYQSIKYISLLMFIPVFLIIIFAKTGLNLWIGSDFANHSYRIAQILAISTFFIAFSSAPYGLIQATGRSDITTKILFFQLPVYIPALWFFSHWYGLTGVALASLIRVIVASIILHICALRLLKK